MSYFIRYSSLVELILLQSFGYIRNWFIRIYSSDTSRSYSDFRIIRRFVNVYVRIHPIIGYFILIYRFWRERGYLILYSYSDMIHPIEAIHPICGLLNLTCRYWIIYGRIYWGFTFFQIFKLFFSENTEFYHTTCNYHKFCFNRDVYNPEACNIYCINSNNWFLNTDETAIKEWKKSFVFSPKEF